MKTENRPNNVVSLKNNNKTQRLCAFILKSLIFYMTVHSMHMEKKDIFLFEMYFS